MTYNAVPAEKATDPKGELFDFKGVSVIARIDFKFLKTVLQS